MRALAIFGALPPTDATIVSHPVLIIDEMHVRGAIVPLAEPHFDRAHPEFASRVLVRVAAFSCNFRDKGFLLRR